MRRSKYNAKPTEVDGIRFASQKEANRYWELKMLEKAGKIHGIVTQPAFPLGAFQGVGELPRLLGRYVADFAYCRCIRTTCSRSDVVVEDVKGFKTPLYRWKKKHVEAQYGIEIREV